MSKPDYRPLAYPLVAFAWVLTLMMAYSEGRDDSIEATRRSLETATHWQAEAERCYSSVAPGVYLMQRGYRVLRAATQRRVVVEVGEVDAP